MTHKTLWKLSASLLLILQASAAFSLHSSDHSDEIYDLSLEDLINLEISTASKYEQKTHEAPAVISVITAQEIERFGANSLLEILDRAASLSMTGSFFFPQNVASIRGDMSSHSDNHILLLFNGRPMRESFTGGEHFSIYTAFPIKMIKQIEIVRGPGSVLYGSNAFTGVINIITKGADEIDNELSVSLGSFSTTSFESTGSYFKDDFELSAGLHYFKEDGWNFGAIDNNGDPDSFDAAENNTAFMLTGAYKNFQFNSVLTQSTQDFWGSTSSWSGSVEQSDRDVSSDMYMFDLGHHLAFNEQSYLNSNISYSESDFSHFNYDAASKNTFAELTYHWNLSKDIRWLIGSTAWHQKVSSEAGLRPAPVPAFSQNWFSQYSQLSYDMTEKLNWVLGAQTNKIPDVSSNTVPRAGFIYQLNNTSGIKLMHGQAFRAAFGVETHFDFVLCCNTDGTNRGGLRGNPSLEPETITTTNLQYYRYGNAYQFNATFFYSEQEDLIERSRAADNVLDFLNRGKLKSQGFELEHKYAITINSQISSSFSYQKNSSKQVASNTTIDNISLQANRMFKVGYSNRFKNNIVFGLFDSWFDDAHDNIVLNPNRIEVNPEASAYHLVSANIKIPLQLTSRAFGKRATINLYSYNLLDEEIYQPEIAGKVINTNPLRAGRSFYLSFALSI